MVTIDRVTLTHTPEGTHLAAEGRDGTRRVSWAGDWGRHVSVGPAVDALLAALEDVEGWQPDEEGHR